MSADALFWVTLTILVGIYAIWWEEEREVRGQDRQRSALKPLESPPEAG
jgi:hypothetical protein